MLTEAAHALGHKVVILDPTPNSPAGQVADEQIVGDYRDAIQMKALAEKSDVLTYEVESVNAEALLEISAHKAVNPTPKTLLLIKDKLAQKAFLAQKGIPVAEFAEVKNDKIAMQIGDMLGYPFLLKARIGGFDGRGNALIQSVSDIPEALAKLGANLYAEKYIPFERECSVIAIRTKSGEIVTYPLIETVHRDHICHMTFAPMKAPETLWSRADYIATRVLKVLDGAGVFGIEMFTIGDEVIVNEIAPRVHNSGHWTIEGAETNQFEQHIRAVTSTTLGPVSLKAPCSVMINVLGERDGAAAPQGITEAEKIKGVKVHIYGKMETRVRRKMGHITAIADTLDEAKKNAETARSLITI